MYYKAVQNSENIVVFVIENTYYAINIAYVRELCTFKTLTKLPLSPVFVKGVYDREGDIIPVIGLRELFGISGHKDFVCGVIVQHLEQTVVIAVDRITGIFPSKTAKAIGNSISSVNTFHKRCIKKIMKLSNGIQCYWIDIEQVLFELHKTREILVSIPFSQDNLQI